MKLIGLMTGEYKETNYAKIITLEEFNRGGCRGFNAIVSKIDYKLASETILPEWELYKDQEVILSYDRFGKVQSVSVI